MQISKLLNQVEANAIVLPEFQREFVWKDSQAKELLNSLVREYPIGGLLVWSTTDPPEIKNDQLTRKNRRYSGSFWTDSSGLLSSTC